MTLDLASLPLALVAGVVTILSPCVWPLVPVVMSSAATSGRTGPLFLAIGLSTAFALSGTVLTLLLLTLGLDPELFRYVAASLLIVVGLILVIKPLSDWVTLRLSGISSRFGGAGRPTAGSPIGQFGVGALLGLVWLPCVGPTLGAAIALASLGQDLILAFLVMFTFGLGTAAMLLIAGLATGRLLQTLRPTLMTGAQTGKYLLGGLLLGLGLLVWTGIDKMLEAWALGWLPDWAIGI